MTRLNRLKSEARESSYNAGHEVGRFTRIGDASAEAKCKHCEASVIVNADPMPNGIDISGDVYGLTCNKMEIVEGPIIIFG